MTTNRLSAIRLLLLCALTTAALGACSPATPNPATPTASSDSPPTAGETPSPADDGSGPPSSTPAATPCELTTVSRTIEHLRLASADESCTVLIPASAAVGTIPVRASATDTVASVEQRTANGTLYATTGSIELTEVGATIAGQLTASDETPPATGTITTSFSLTVP